MNYVFDLDGTLTFDGTEISPLITKELMRINRTNKLIFASARPVRDMLPLLDDFPENDLIGGNGSIVRSRGKIYTTKSLSTGTVKQIIGFIEQNQLEYVLDYDWNYSARITSSNEIMNKLDIRHEAKNVPLQEENVIKAILFHVSPELHASLTLDKQNAVLYHADSEELVITAEGIDKHQILKTLIGDQEYTAFGNDKNDAELLKNAAYPVVVGNNPEVLQYGKICLDSNAETVANFLRKC
jgi:HAD superfamily hydrolase (TIGR01484 family)